MPMTSLQRTLAAIRGEPFDQYPVVMPSPTWSMMPHWPAMVGLNFLHLSHGSQEQHLCALQALHEQVGLDWLPVHGDVPYTGRGRYRVATEDGVPVLVDIGARTKTRFEEFPKDLPPKEPLFDTARDVESLPPVPTAEELLASGACDLAKAVVARFGQTVFLKTDCTAPFPHCYYVLGHEKLFDCMLFEPSLLFALMERETEAIAQRARLTKLLGVPCLDIMEFFCSADLISEEHYLRFAFPYEQKVVRAIKEQGLLVGMNLMGSIEPRLPHLKKLELNYLQVEASLKGYRNDLAVIREALGEEVCLFGNSHAVEVIELGDEETWRRAALEQVRGVGQQRRYAIGAGTPVTWATTPERFRCFAEFTRRVLAEAAPPRG